ncbi:MAG: hypothetical protein Q8O93_06045 [bacterium]|nr:hypothetical protein [bacterium]
MKERLGPISQDDGDIRGNLKTEFGWTIEGPFYSNVPTPNPELIERCSQSITRLTDHLLKTVIINDGFGADHGARRKFEKFHPEADSFNSKFSKLGGNNLLGCYFSMDDIIDRNRKRPEIYEALKNVAQLPELEKELAGYNEMTLDEKIAFARKMDEIVFKFLSVLTQ